jgi:hypothetical protein
VAEHDFQHVPERVGYRQNATRRAEPPDRPRLLSSVNGQSRAQVQTTSNGAAGRREEQAGSYTIVGIWPVELVANGCGAGHGAGDSKGARRLTGLLWHALPGTLAVLSCPAKCTKPGSAFYQVSRCPAFGSCRPHAFRPWSHTDGRVGTGPRAMRPRRPVYYRTAAPGAW